MPRAKQPVEKVADGQGRVMANRSPQREGTPPPTNTTAEVYGEFIRRFELDMPLEQFVGLCGYLCTILTWGGRMHENEMDLFVSSYPAFTTYLGDVECQRMHDPNVPILSYHRWFHNVRQDEMELETGYEPEMTINERRLRQIWSENPYSFLRAQLSLEFLIGIGRRTGHSGDAPVGEIEELGAMYTE